MKKILFYLLMSVTLQMSAQSTTYFGKPVELGAVPKSISKADSVLVRGTDKIIKFVPRSEFGGSAKTFDEVLGAGPIATDKAAIWRYSPEGGAGASGVTAIGPMLVQLQDQTKVPDSVKTATIDPTGINIQGLSNNAYASDLKWDRLMFSNRSLADNSDTFTFIHTREDNGTDPVQTVVKLPKKTIETYLPLTVNGVPADRTGNIEISGGGSQNLEQTLTNGNEATNDIHLKGDSPNKYVELLKDQGIYIGTESTTGGTLTMWDDLTKRGLEIYNNRIIFTDQLSGTNFLTLKYLPTGAGKSTQLAFPTNTGVDKYFALSVNGNYADANGNIELSGGGSQNIQQVLLEGNEVVSDTLSLKFKDLSSQYRSSLDYGGLTINDDASDKTSQIAVGQIEVSDNINGMGSWVTDTEGIKLDQSTSNGYFATIKSTGLINTRPVYLLPVNPDGEYTLATENQITLQKIADNGAVASKGQSMVRLFQDEGGDVYSHFLGSADSSFSREAALSLNYNLVELYGGNNSDSKYSSVRFEDGDISINRKQGSTNTTSLKFLDPSVVSTINIPAPDTAGTYTLATTDQITLQQTLGNGTNATFDDGNNTADILTTLSGARKRVTFVTGTSGFGTSQFSVHDQLAILSNNTGSNLGGSFSVANGLSKIQQDNGSVGTTVQFNTPTSASTLNFPAPSVSGDYDLATTVDLPIMTTRNAAPSSATATGVKGDIRIDDNYIYLCVATNTWKRSPLSTW